jgi:hypothetical protein
VHFNLVVYKQRFRAEDMRQTKENKRVILGLSSSLGKQGGMQALL